MTDKTANEAGEEGKQHPPSETDTNKTSLETTQKTDDIAEDLEKIKLSSDEKEETSPDADNSKGDGQNGIWSSGSEGDEGKAGVSLEASEAGPADAAEEPPLASKLPNIDIPESHFSQDLIESSYDEPLQLRDACLAAWRDIRALPKNQDMSDEQLLGIYHDLGQHQVKFEAEPEPLSDASLEEQEFLKHARRFNDKTSRFGIWPRGLEFSHSSSAFTRESEHHPFQHITVRSRELGMSLIQAVQEGRLNKADLRQIRYRLLGMQCSFFVDTAKYQEAFGNLVGSNHDAHEKSLRRWKRFMHGQLDPRHISLSNFDGVVIELSGWDWAGFSDWDEIANQHRETMLQNARNSGGDKKLAELYSSWALLYDLDPAALGEAGASGVDIGVMHEVARLLRENCEDWDSM